MAIDVEWQYRAECDFRAFPCSAGTNPYDFSLICFAMSITTAANSLLRFSGHENLRNRVVLSIISGKPVRIDNIRSDDKEPGLRGKIHFGTRMSGIGLLMRRGRL